VAVTVYTEEVVHRLETLFVQSRTVTPVEVLKSPEAIVTVTPVWSAVPLVTAAVRVVVVLVRIVKVPAFQ